MPESIKFAIMGITWILAWIYMYLLATGASHASTINLLNFMSSLFFVIFMDTEFKKIKREIGIDFLNDQKMDWVFAEIAGWFVAGIIVSTTFNLIKDDVNYGMNAMVEMYKLLEAKLLSK